MVEGAPHTAGNNQLVYSRVPLPPYIKEQGGGWMALGRAKEGRTASPSLLYIRGEGGTLEHTS